MTLEDFFTLTEMKDGLTTIARVEELVSVMQKEKDDATKNIGDAARQWSTVAGVIAATEFKDCLNHFVQLDGIHFLNLWLQEAQKCTSDTNEGFVKEAVEALLAAVEKLPISSKDLSTSGISATVQHLIDSNRFSVQERARVLFNRWNEVAGKVTHCPDPVDEGGGASCGEDPNSVNKTIPDKSSIEGVASHVKLSDTVKSTDEGAANHDKLSDNEGQHSNIVRDLSVHKMVLIKDLEVPSSNQDTKADGNVLCGGSSLGSSLVSSTSQKAFSVAEDPLRCAREGMIFSESHSSPIAGDINADDISDVSEVKNASEDQEAMEIEMSINEDSPCKLKMKETCAVFMPSDTERSETMASSSANPCSERSELEPQPENGVLDTVMTKYPSNEKESTMAGQAGESYTKLSPDLSSSETLGIDNDADEHASVSDLKRARVTDSLISCGSFKSNIDCKHLDKMDRRGSELELDYGIEDPLEIACLVAKKVEREVVDYREPCCSSSSSEKNSEGKIEQPGSPDSEAGPDQPLLEQLNQEESPTKDISDDDGGFSPKVKRLRISNETEVESNYVSRDLKSTPLTKVPEKSVANVNKTKCDFDLNEDVFTEEVECFPISNQSSSTTLTTPIPVIPTSKGVGSLPVIPLLFEGELGWRGSAATSAFRPASPRRTLDGEKSYLSESSSQGSKQRQNFLNIDLNVAEGDEEPVAHIVSTKQALGSGLPSAESFAEISSKKAERLKLDLNLLGDQEEPNPFPLSDQRVEGRLFHRLQHSRNRSPSPASSSSRQPSTRDFDLNNNPSFFDVCGLQEPTRDLNKPSSQESKSYGNFRLDDPTVSIMGWRMEIERKDFINRTQMFLPNGQGSESSIGSNPFRVGVAGAGTPQTPVPPPPFGYNGLNMGHTMPLHPQIYGPASVPYMVDSRGATVIPQIMGSPSGVSPPFPIPPFLMSITGPQSGMNTVGPPRSGLDLNSGVASIVSESREMGGLNSRTWWFNR